MSTYRPAGSFCTFTDLNNGIWEFKFLVANHNAVDEWIAWQEFLMQNYPAPADNVARMLLDIRWSGLPPFLYALEQARRWRNQYPQLDTTPIKTALLMKPTGALKQRYAELIKDGVNVFGMNMIKVELFPDVYDQAISWLLEP